MTISHIQYAPLYDALDGVDEMLELLEKTGITQTEDHASVAYDFLERARDALEGAEYHLTKLKEDA